MRQTGVGMRRVSGGTGQQPASGSRVRLVLLQPCACRVSSASAASATEPRGHCSPSLNTATLIQALLCHLMGYCYAHPYAHLYAEGRTSGLFLMFLARWA